MLFYIFLNITTIYNINIYKYYKNGHKNENVRGF